MKYSKELHERVRQNLRMFDYPRFDDGDIDALLDEIERLQAERRWIPVSERLPEEGVEVLVFDEKGDYLTDCLRRWQNGSLNWENDDDGVTHWMPLPEPPEEK